MVLVHYIYIYLHSPIKYWEALPPNQITCCRFSEPGHILGNILPESATINLEWRDYFLSPIPPPWEWVVWKSAVYELWSILGAFCLWSNIHFQRGAPVKRFFCTTGFLSSSPLSWSGQGYITITIELWRLSSMMPGWCLPMLILIFQRALRFAGYLIGSKITCYHSRWRSSVLSCHASFLAEFASQPVRWFSICFTKA
jgi:hypothetical protein